MSKSMVAFLIGASSLYSAHIKIQITETSRKRMDILEMKIERAFSQREVDRP